MPPPTARRSSIDIGRALAANRTRASASTSNTGTPADQDRYGWGPAPALYGGQDLASQFRTQFQPGGGLFAPSFPLVPVEPELARLWDYPVGYNYIYTPRSYEPISFEELRALANNENLTRMAIETRKDQIEKLEWQIKPTDEKNPAKDAEARIKKLTKLWHHPDGERPFASWLREALEDMLVIDAPSFEVLKNRDGSVRGYDIVDGSCYSEDTEVLTRRGWLRFADVNDGDEFATRNQKTKMFEWQRATYFHVADYVGPMVHLHSRAVDILVSPNHRVLLDRLPRQLGGHSKRPAREQIVKAADLTGLNKTAARIPMTSSWLGEEIEDKIFDLPAGQSVSWKRPAVGGVEKICEICGVPFVVHLYRADTARFCSRGCKSQAADSRRRSACLVMSGDDFCAFMGMWLADGSTDHEGSVWITKQKSNRAWAPWNELLTRILGKPPIYTGANFVICSKSLVQYLQQFGLALKKFVPQQIMDATPRQIEIFWRYFSLGDGAAGRDRVFTSSPRMADQLVELAQKRGLSASVSRRVFEEDLHFADGRVVPAANCSDNFIVSIRTTDAMRFSVSTEMYSGKIRCVSVPNEILYVRRNGKPAWCGNTIKVLIDITGRRPTAPAPAYEQIIHGRPWRLFNEDELIYAPRNKRPGHVYGYSPVEQILMFINIALRRQQTQLLWFSEGNLPQGFMSIPELNATQVAQLQQYWDDRLAGNLAERSRFMPLPYGAKWQAVKQPPLKDDFDEWLARVVMFCFSLPPDAFIRQRARAAAESARQSALEEGLAPLMIWVKRLADGEIQGRLGSPDLEFAWQDIKQVDPEIQNKIETTYVIKGMKTVDEARDVMGLDPLPGGIGSQPFIVAGNQVIMLKDVEQISERAANPPPPPPSITMHPGTSPQVPGAPGPTRSPPGGGGGSQNGRGGATAPGDQRHGARGDDPAATAGRGGTRKSVPRTFDYPLHNDGSFDFPPKPGSVITRFKAAARTLIVKRPLKNASDLISWAKTQGFTSTLLPEDMHVTVAYSRQPVDWTAAGDHFDEVRSSNPEGRSVAMLGDQGAVVLKFDQPELQHRWRQFLDAGASWDYDGYQPHVTITYEGAPTDLSKVEPFTGELLFGPERFDEIDDDWKDKLDERVTKGDARQYIPNPRFSEHLHRSFSSLTAPQPGVDVRRRESLNREARQLLRRHRAARIEADLGAPGA